MKPWSQKWEAIEKAWSHYVDEVGECRNTVASVHSPEDARLIAAAPDMARALVRTEWRSFAAFEERCSHCGMRPTAGHMSFCDLDMALTKAGIDDAERRRMRGKKGDIDASQ
jgi:hypothetical protein